ncbi:MAG: hypothetical protein IPF55_21170 [Rhodoferax sp.]|nr:hypothetical protein [Rhodoferax sp.]
MKDAVAAMTQLRNEIKTELGVGVEDPEIMQLNANIGAVNVELGNMDGALNVVATAAIGNMVNSAGDAGATLKLRFGNNDNQVSHAFRHVDDAGLDRGAVRDAISNDLSNLGPSPPDGLCQRPSQCRWRRHRLRCI